MASKKGKQGDPGPQGQPGDQGFNKEMLVTLTQLTERQGTMTNDIGEIKDNMKEIKTLHEQTLLVVSKHSQTLYGEKGENGLVGMVKAMWRKLDGLNIRMAGWGGAILILAFLLPIALGWVHK